MGLSERLSRYAVRRAHVLIVEAPGSWVVRAHLERAALERGWRPALSPADADVLAVCGAPGPELSVVIERLWEQLPGPRVRVNPLDVAGVPAALNLAVERLRDTDRHREDARSRSAEPDLESSSDGREDMDHEDLDHEDLDHEDMDHGDMEMAPDGIALAGSDDDRDGLEMDVLHLRLGPVLPHWPAGLVLRCTLQGDVITEAEGHLLDGGSAAYLGAGATDLAWRWDNIARLLALAGWEDTAARARRIRDAQLRTDWPRGSDASLGAVRRQLARSRTLHWSLRGLRPLTAKDLQAHGFPEHLVGDTYDRLLSMLDRAVDAAESAPGSVAELPVQQTPSMSPEPVASVVVGLDLAAARLVVASLDLPPLPAAKVMTRA
ncbi:MAG: hypothetical protein ACR2FV_07880 [Ornithinimicrobium sp.]|uniref:hypothetical protein n=1 Tax=Ornithinimicrobium sp. TaxID=1977084 RepID=UPI003D9B594C